VRPKLLKIVLFGHERFKGIKLALSLRLDRLPRLFQAVDGGASER
jgi:hypothetical protein